MAKMIRNKIEFNTGRYYFNLNLKSSIVVITGDSSIGKTLFFDKYAVECAALNDDKVVFINFLTQKSMIDAVMKLNDKIFVIDNADIIPGYDITFFNNKVNNNQYIIIGRSIFKYTRDTKSIATLQEYDKSKFRLFYPYRKEV